MANVQKENGYTEIANELLEALYQVPLSSTEFRILLYILRKTYGFKKKSDWISQKQIAKEFGIYKQHVSRAIKELKTKNMITNNIEKNKKILGVQKDYGKWELPKLVTNKLQELVTNKNKVTRIGYQSNQNRLPKVTKIGTHKRNYTKETITKEERKKTIPIPYKEIIDYLNQKTGKNFKGTTTKTMSFIKARFGEGYVLDDFRSVIDKKTAKWKNDPKMCDYLRPETLFGTKFESYLNEKIDLEAITTEEARKCYMKNIDDCEVKFSDSNLQQKCRICLKRRYQWKS